MGNGFFIGRSDKHIEKFVQNSGELSLLAKGDGAEVMLQKIKAKETVFIEPGDVSESMEFLYIIEGELEVDKEGIKSFLKSGDYLYVHHLKETIQFNTLTNVTLLYFSTHPQFYFLSTTINELIELVNKVEQKDRYTHNHNQRVKDYALKIGNKLNLPKERIETLVFAALFHDLGKVHIPDEILNKPGILSAEEFEHIKKHSSDGAHLVEKTYYENIAKIIEQHHEKLDGSGYPNGLKDEEILYEAKIISVSDAYDAMTTDRPYRKGLLPQVAIEELISLKGIYYDGKIVDTFIEVLKEEGVI